MKLYGMNFDFDFSVKRNAFLRAGSSEKRSEISLQRAITHKENVILKSFLPMGLR